MKEENEKLREENEQLRKNIVVKDAEIKESIENPTEIKSPKEDKNTADSYPNWFDKIKFKKILAIIDSSIFDYKNKWWLWKWRWWWNNEPKGKKYKNKATKWHFRWNNWQIKIIWIANKIVLKNRKSKTISVFQRFGR